MPELPEVDAIKLQLQKFLIGHTVTDIDIRYKKTFEGDEKHIIGTKIKDVRRFGKVLSIDFANDYSLVIHIKLTGQLIYRGPNLPKAPALSKKVSDGLGGKHTLIVIDLDREGRLFYNDFRRFGWFKVVKTPEVLEMKFIKELGPEPFRDLTLPYFREILVKTRRAIKTLIMDQAKIGGIGNIYANDALWLAQINPETPANVLDDTKVIELYKAIETVLRRGIEHGGASELSFVIPDGSEGEYQKFFLAYGRDGDPCPRCHKAKFEKIKVGGRGTVFCPVCQVKLGSSDTNGELFKL